MSINLKAQFLSPFPSNSQESILLQIEGDKPTVFTPKLLKWDEFTFLDELEIPNTQPPAQIERKYIDQIIEEPDDRVILKFWSSFMREDLSLLEPSNSRSPFLNTLLR